MRAKFAVRIIRVKKHNQQSLPAQDRQAHKPTMSSIYSSTVGIGFSTPKRERDQEEPVLPPRVPKKPRLPTWKYMRIVMSVTESAMMVLGDFSKPNQKQYYFNFVQDIMRNDMSYLQPFYRPQDIIPDFASMAQSEVDKSRLAMKLLRHQWGDSEMRDDLLTAILARGDRKASKVHQFIEGTNPRLAIETRIVTRTLYLRVPLDYDLDLYDIKTMREKWIKQMQHQCINVSPTYLNGMDSDAESIVTSEDEGTEEDEE
jgi:hypothetical protein